MTRRKIKEKKNSTSRVIFATSNEQKVIEARLAVAPYGVELEHSCVDVDEIKDLDVFKVAGKKALDTFAQLKKPVVVEDTGVFFHAFPGFPGTYSKFCIQTIGVKNTVKVLDGHSKKAHFSTIVCYCDGKSVKSFEGKIEGEVVLQPRGVAPLKVPYDTVFVPTGEKKTFAELGEKRKNEISARAMAFRKFAEWFSHKKRV